MYSDVTRKFNLHLSYQNELSYKRETDKVSTKKAFVSFTNCKDDFSKKNIPYNKYMKFLYESYKTDHCFELSLPAPVSKQCPLEDVFGSFCYTPSECRKCTIEQRGRRAAAGWTSTVFLHCNTKRNYCRGPTVDHTTGRQPVIASTPKWIRITAGSDPVIPIPLTDLPDSFRAASNFSARAFTLPLASTPPAERRLFSHWARSHSREWPSATQPVAHATH